MTTQNSIEEQFTFRANGREMTVDDAVIDPDAPRTVIAESILNALQFESPCDIGALPSEAPRSYRCVVAWTIYETQGYRSLLDVAFTPGAARTVIGSDFLDPHQLRVDATAGGLVGRAPPNATPLTAGWVRS